LTVNSAAPTGWRYYNEAWFKRETLTGPNAIAGRFSQLSVFSKQTPPPTKPGFADVSQSLKNRRQSLREEKLALVRQYATQKFPALLGYSWYWWPPLEMFTLEQLVKNKTELKQLFDEVPTNCVTMTDFIILFNLSSLPLVELASDSAYSEKDARLWLKKLHYDPSIHFEVGCERFPISILTRVPYSIKWQDLPKYHFRYTDIYGWKGFFKPSEMMQLRFSFEQAVCETGDEKHQVLTADKFRIMVDKGKWTYHTLCECLDFTPIVIEALGLTQVDLRDKLKWKPPPAKSAAVDDLEAAQAATPKDKSKEEPTEWLSQESFDDLPLGEQPRKKKKHHKSKTSSSSSNDKNKRSKHKSKDKHHKSKRKDEDEEANDNSEG